MSIGSFEQFMKVKANEVRRGLRKLLFLSMGDKCKMYTVNGFNNSLF